jgi:hypothetical protein
MFSPGRTIQKRGGCPILAGLLLARVGLGFLFIPTLPTFFVIQVLNRAASCRTVLVLPQFFTHRYERVTPLSLSTVELSFPSGYHYPISPRSRPQLSRYLTSLLPPAPLPDGSLDACPDRPNLAPHALLPFSGPLLLPTSFTGNFNRFQDSFLNLELTTENYLLFSIVTHVNYTLTHPPPVSPLSTSLTQNRGVGVVTFYLTGHSQKRNELPSPLSPFQQPPHLSKLPFPPVSS